MGSDAADQHGWSSFRAELESHYVRLEALHTELGGNHDANSLKMVLRAALDASLEETQAECERIRKDCESLANGINAMRTAMGDSSSDPFSSRSQVEIKAPLLDSQKVLRIEYATLQEVFSQRAEKVLCKRPIYRL